VAVVTVAICTAVFVGCLLGSWKLAKFLKACDERHEYVVIDLRKASVVAEAERICQEAAK
jgi:hypothetical protein